MPPSDRTERRIRFIFGAVFGLVIGLFSAPRVTNSGWLGVLCVIGTGIVFGLLARRYGDRFWSSVSSIVWRVWRWWS